MRHETKPFAGSTAAFYTSPACSMHEVDPAYMGYWTDVEIAAFLTTLLKNERALTRASTLLVGRMEESAIGNILRHSIKLDKHFCRLIMREILVRGGEPTLETGVLFAKVMRSSSMIERLRTLKIGYKESLGEIDGALRSILDQHLHAILTSLLEARRQTIQALKVA